jgi:hypothetical protein
MSYLGTGSGNGVDGTWVAEDLVLAHEGSCRAVRNHEPRVEARILGGLEVSGWLTAIDGQSF